MDTFRYVIKMLLRMLFAASIVFIAAICNKYLLFPMLDAVFGVPDAVEPAVKVVGSLTVIAMAYWSYVKFFERRAVSELSFHGRHMVMGIVSGAALISLTTIILFAIGNYEFVSYRGFSSVLIVVFPVLAVSIFEEFMFRGVLFRMMEQSFGTLKSLLVVSILFSALHMANEGANVMVFISATLISILWCGVYVVSRNIWVAGLHHAAWNLAVFSSGIPISGMVDWTKHAPLESNYHGPVWLTGGSFGPEGSVITVIIGATSLFVLLRWAWRNDRFIEEPIRKDSSGMGVTTT